MLSPKQIAMLSGLICPYCKADTKQMPARQYYGKGSGFVWFCAPCKAVEWATADGNEAIGRVAKNELRILREEVAKALASLRCHTNEPIAETVERFCEMVGAPAGYRKLNYLSEESLKSVKLLALKEREKSDENEPKAPDYWRTKY